MKAIAARAVLLGALGIAAGCDATVASGLAEGEANRILVALEAQDIGADKLRIAAGTDETLWDVTVAPDDVGRALAVLRAADLPRAPEPGINEVFGEGSLVPTATEERARYAAALAGELAASIEAIDGVLDARVHVAIPEVRDFALDDAPPAPRASVLIKHRPGEPPYDEVEIKALVAGAVDGMTAENVAVVGVPGPATPEPTASSLVRVGPISVTRGSAFALKAMLGGALLLNLLLAAALIFVSMRKRRATAPEAPGEAS